MATLRLTPRGAAASAVLAGIVVLGSLVASTRTSAITFSDVTRPAGIDARTPTDPAGDLGSGAAFADFDGDGDIDVYVVMGRGQPNRLYLNDGSGRFVDRATDAGCADTGWGTSVTVADYDNDGDPDIFLANHGGPNRLFRNDGTGSFEDVTIGAGLALTAPALGAAWGDYDHDGWLDLYVGIHDLAPNRLYHNNGDGTFTDVAATLGVDAAAKPTCQVAWVDIDNDGDLDLYLAQDLSRGNDLFRNEGNGTFTDVSATSGAGVAVAAMGIAAGDYDGDGFVDLFVTATSPGPVLLRNRGDGTFLDATVAAGIPAGGSSRGAALIDVDNDGDLDLYVVRRAGAPGQPPANVLLRNDGGVFADVTATSGAGDDGPGFGLAAGDYDGDGAVDLFVVNRDSASVLLHNAGGGTWLRVRTRGRIGNRDGIGARVRVVHGSRVQVRFVDGGSGYLGCNERTLHFGLGGAAAADTVEVTWPSGVRDVLTGVAANTTLTVVEGQTVYGPGSFVPMAATAGIHLAPVGAVGRYHGSGVAFADYDDDGDDDLFVADSEGRPAHLLRNDGGYFRDVTDAAGVRDTRAGKTPAFADYDNDGDLDFYLCIDSAPNRLYRNNGDGTFTNVAAAAGVDVGGYSAGACWGDYDNDGDVDLFVVNYRTPDRLYRNEGDGTFTDVAPAAGVASPKAGLVGAFVDVDNDHDLDIFVAVDKLGGNLLYRNEGDGTFTDVSASAGANQQMNAMGIAVGDYDGNGYLDIYVSNNADGHVLLRNNGDGTFTDVAGTLGVRGFRIGWGNAFFDADNDGDVDLYVVHWAPMAGEMSGNLFFRNNGDGTFTDATAATGLGDTRPSYGLALADANLDGTLDLLVGNQNAPVSWYVGVPTSNHWLRIRARGVVSNRDAIGARITLWAGGRRQIREVGSGSSYLSHHSLTTHFGLGGATRIDTMRVEWPTGWVDVFTDLDVDRTITIAEGDSREPLVFTGPDAVPGVQGVTITWDVSWTFGVDRFEILRGTPGADDDAVVATLPSTAAGSWTDTNILPGGAYRYRVRAVLANGSAVESPPVVVLVSGSGVFAFTFVDAEWTGRDVLVQWTVSAAEGLAGFAVDREDAEGGARVRVSGADPLAPTRRFFRDATAGPSRRWRYTVVAVRNDGTEIASSPVTVATPAAAFRVEPGFPNPTAGSTTFRWMLPANSTVTLEVFDVAGRRVRTLLDEMPMLAGAHALDWDGRGDDGRPVSAGIYFYRVRWAHGSATRKLTIIR